MPVARYLVFVGGALAALLFIPGWLLPKPPAIFANQSVALDRAGIRIKSAHKWPAKVILDTGQLTVKSAEEGWPSSALEALRKVSPEPSLWKAEATREQHRQTSFGQQRDTIGRATTLKKDLKRARLFDEGRMIACGAKRSIAKRV